jgi:sugar/nucleoside kinase (ribokinase family)
LPDQPSKTQLKSPKIAVIGTASRDTIHSEVNGERSTFHTIGGSGLYTALASNVSGGRVTLMAPQPDSFTEPFLRVSQMITWKGPQVREADLPRLEIIHHGDGRATLLTADWGAEAELTPDTITGPLDEFDVVHIAALSSAVKQKEMLDRVRALGAKTVSCGTYFRLVKTAPDVVHELVQSCDYFFMNLNEFQTLYQGGLPESGRRKALFVTENKGGCSIYSQGEAWKLPTEEVQEIDPTGAGDTFCGATVTAMAAGLDATDAALEGMMLAAICVKSPGPQFMIG